MGSEGWGYCATREIFIFRLIQHVEGYTVAAVTILSLRNEQGAMARGL